MVISEAVGHSGISHDERHLGHGLCFADKTSSEAQILAIPVKALFQGAVNKKEVLQWGVAFLQLCDADRTQRAVSENIRRRFAEMSDNPLEAIALKNWFRVLAENPKMNEAGDEHLGQAVKEEMKALQ